MKEKQQITTEWLKQQNRKDVFYWSILVAMYLMGLVLICIRAWLTLGK